MDYRVWIKGEQFDVSAPSIYVAKSKAADLFKLQYSNFKYNKAVVISMARVKRLQGIIDMLDAGEILK